MISGALGTEFQGYEYELSELRVRTFGVTSSGFRSSGCAFPGFTARVAPMLRILMSKVFSRCTTFLRETKKYSFFSPRSTSNTCLYGLLPIRHTPSTLCPGIDNASRLSTPSSSDSPFPYINPLQGSNVTPAPHQEPALGWVSHFLIHFQQEDCVSDIWLSFFFSYSPSVETLLKNLRRYSYFKSITHTLPFLSVLSFDVSTLICFW